VVLDQCATSGVHAATASGDGTTFTLDPTTNFASSEQCTVTVMAANVADQDTNDPPDQMAANYTFSFQTAGTDLCGDPVTKIGEIQGEGATAAKTGNVTVEGVVVGDFEGTTAVGLQGFYLQDSGDGNPATSDGSSSSPRTTRAP
jgi:predicted extracellular nuclease